MKASRVNYYSCGIISYFLFQIKTICRARFVTRKTKPTCVAHKRSSGFALLLRTRWNPRGEHDRLIIQHNLDARVKHRFRLRKGTDRETIAGRALTASIRQRRKPAPRFYLNLFWTTVVRPIRSSQRKKHRGGASPAGRPRYSRDSRNDSRLAPSPRFVLR